MIMTMLISSTCGDNMMAQHLQSVVGVRVKEDEEGAGRSQNLKSQILDSS